MKVTLHKEFPVPAGADAAWAFLQDLEAVTRCMPGAAITERIDERHFKGTVSVRFGPASMVFRGEVEVTRIDAAGRTLRLLGKGTDSTGTSGASMDLTARIEAAGETASLVGAAEVSVSGKAAAFGNRMIGAVADQVLKQFGANLASQAAGLAARASTGAPPAGPGADAAAASEAAPPPRLNGLALLWAVFRAWLRAVFGRSAA
jgi:carbon monoxide dehydrogenase subunit G